MADSDDFKWVLITGAAGTIGRALVQEFESKGWGVITTDAAELERENHVTLDLANGLSDSGCEREALISAVKAVTLNGLSAVIHNAALQCVGSLTDISTNDVNASLGVNVIAPLSLAQIFWDDLTGNEGAYVGISSIHAKLTKKDFLAYSVSKSAFSGLIRALSLESEGKVRVNAIAPAAIDTPMLRAGFARQSAELAKLGAMHPTGRIGMPQEVAALASFLVIDAPDFLNGAIVPLDGGIGNVLKDPL